MKGKKIIGLALAAVMAVSAPLTAYAGGVKAVVKAKNYTYNGTVVMKTKTKVPKITGKIKGAAKMNAYFAKESAKVIKGKETKGYVSYAKETLDKNSENFNTYFATLKYKYTYNKNGKIGFKKEYSQYTGGAHGVAYMIGEVFDKKTGKKLPLSKWTNYDPKVLKGKILESTRKMLNKKFPTLTTSNNSTMEMLKKRPLNKFTGYLKGDCLYVVYQLYDIGPYAIGMPIAKVKL